MRPQEGLTPLRPGPAVDKLVADDPNWKPFIDGIAFGGPEPLLTDYMGLQNIMIEMVQSVVTGAGRAGSCPQEGCCRPRAVQVVHIGPAAVPCAAAVRPPPSPRRQFRTPAQETTHLMSELILKDLRKSFGDVEIIKGIDLDVTEGEFVVFVGPSGCGKSTLLRMIAGLEDVTAGDIVIGGKVVNDLPPVKRGIAMVFQSYALYPHMIGVREHRLSAARREPARGRGQGARRRAPRRCCSSKPRLEQRPGTLSGGQRQRVAIGRAIVRQPKIFLFDEPLSNLDAALRSEMRIELMGLHKQLGSTMVYVTHDQVEAMTMADKIVVLNAGQHRADRLARSSSTTSPTTCSSPASSAARR